MCNICFAVFCKIILFPLLRLIWEGKFQSENVNFSMFYDDEVIKFWFLLNKQQTDR